MTRKTPKGSIADRIRRKDEESKDLVDSLPETRELSRGQLYRNHARMGGLNEVKLPKRWKKD